MTDVHHPLPPPVASSVCIRWKSADYAPGARQSRPPQTPTGWFAMARCTPSSSVHLRAYRTFFAGQSDLDPFGPRQILPLKKVITRCGCPRGQAPGVIPLSTSSEARKQALPHALFSRNGERKEPAPARLLFDEKVSGTPASAAQRHSLPTHRTTIIKNTEAMKVKRNHHSKNSSRPHRVEIMYSDSEMELLNQRHQLVCNGMFVSRSEFIRRLSLDGEIKVAISAEDRILISKLNTLGVNLWELRKQAHNEGMLNLEIKFKNLIKELEETIGAIQSKIS